MVIHESLTIGFIGMGSRGLSVLERVLSVVQNKPEQPINIIIFEPNTPGCGVHNSNQPDFLLLNTIASQLGIFPDAAALSECKEAKPRFGPNFFEWCQAQDIRVTDKGFVASRGGRPVLESDFLPRRLLGKYLIDAFNTIVDQTPEHVHISIYSERVKNLKLGEWKPNQLMRGYRLYGESGIEVYADNLILTTGHDIQESNALSQIMANQPILMQGLGLTAMDQLASLSQGRGGKFIHDKDKNLIYQKSGQEPKIYIQSREGLIFWTRPNVPQERSRHQALVLTKERVKHFRKTINKQLDFDTDILPLMRLEMRGAALAIKMAGGCAEVAKERIVYMAKIGASLERGVENLELYIENQEAKFGILDCNAILAQVIPQGLDDEGYQEWVISSIEADLTQSRAGLLHSPVKAAAEVWRDLRETLRGIVDFHGLTPTSHRRFYSHWVRIINRLVAGPQKERSEDLLSLIRTGIVTMRHPKKSADRSILRLTARVNFSGLCGTTNGVISDLKSLGCIRAVVAEPGFDGIEVGSDCRAISKDGEVNPNLWILGPITEGSSYYNHYVPAPGAHNRAMADAHCVAIKCTQIKSIY